jgi:lysozyme family protein
MIENWQTCFNHVMQSEGGYSNDVNDPGGETNHGVTKGAWQAYIGRHVHDGEMRELTLEMVEPFYKSRYWDVNRCDELPAGVDYVVFDFGVNAGVKRAAKFLQQALGLEQDGSIGEGTIEAVKNVNAQELVAAFSQVKNQFYNHQAQTNPHLEKFLHGWLNRVASVEHIANQMA